MSHIQCMKDLWDVINALPIEQANALLRWKETYIQEFGFFISNSNQQIEEFRLKDPHELEKYQAYQIKMMAHEAGEKALEFAEKKVVKAEFEERTTFRFHIINLNAHIVESSMDL